MEPLGAVTAVDAINATATYSFCAVVVRLPAPDLIITVGIVQYLPT